MLNDGPAELAGKVILITGASRGIGHAVARAAASAGASTLLCGRDVAALERLADGIEAAGNPPPVLVPINLETAGVRDYALIAEQVDGRMGHLDGVVANAAMLGELAPLATYDAVMWARVFQVNLHSVFLLLQATLPLVQQAPSGSVVFTLAAEGLNAKPHWGAYAGSKFALRGLLEILTREHASRSAVRFNAVVPPPVRTRLRAAAYPAEDPRTLAEPDSVTAPYLMLLGPRGADHRGRIITVDGGSFSP